MKSYLVISMASEYPVLLYQNIVMNIVKNRVVAENLGEWGWSCKKKRTENLGLEDAYVWAWGTVEEEKWKESEKEDTKMQLQLRKEKFFRIKK